MRDSHFFSDNKIQNTRRDFAYNGSARASIHHLEDTRNDAQPGRRYTRHYQFIAGLSPPR